MSLVRPPSKDVGRGPAGNLILGILTLLFALVVAALVWAAVEGGQIAGVETTDPATAGSGRFLEVSGLSLHLVERGSTARPTILLIHGFNPAGGAVWAEVAGMLDQSRLIIPDLIDFGFSERVETTGRVHTVIGRAELLADLLDVLGAERLTVVGSGYGGTVAAQLALLEPDLFQALVIIDGEIYGPPSGWTERLAALPVLGSAIAFNAWGASQRAEDAFNRGCVAGLCPPELVAARRVAAAIPGTAQALASMIATGGASTVVENLSHIEARTLVIWGESDQVTPLDDGRRIAAAIPGAELKLAVATAHSPEMDNPAAVAELIIAFLAAG
jgi:pimeloyl-ACP methyl ester carboxylesterase